VKINIVNIGIARKMNGIKAAPAVIILVEKIPRERTCEYHEEQARLLAKTLEDALPYSTLKSLTNTLHRRWG